MSSKIHHWIAGALCFGLTVVYLFAMRPLEIARATSPDRLVLAFYYAWFDENSWNANRVPDVPAQPYASRDRAAIGRQIDQAKSAGIDAFVVSWYGPQVQNNQTETNFAAMLDEASKRGFRATVDFETRSPFYSNQGDVVNALRSLIGTHASKPAFLRSGGKPVIFFWAIQNVFRNGGQSAGDAWASIRNQVDPNHNTLWIAEGVDISYQSVFDGHHLYSITWNPPTDPEASLGNWGKRVRNFAAQAGSPRIWVATVMPGYNDLKTGRGNAFVTDRGDGRYYAQTWQAAIQSQPDWVMITSWNEYPEGTYIEPSRLYGDTYLNITRQWAGQFKSGVMTEAVAPLPTIAPSPSPSPTRRWETPMPVIMPARPTVPTLAPTRLATLVSTQPKATATLGPTGVPEPVIVHKPFRPTRSSCGMYTHVIDFDCEM